MIARLSAFASGVCATLVLVLGFLYAMNGGAVSLPAVSLASASMFIFVRGAHPLRVIPLVLHLEFLTNLVIAVFALVAVVWDKHSVEHALDWAAAALLIAFVILHGVEDARQLRLENEARVESEDEASQRSGREDGSDREQQDRPDSRRWSSPRAVGNE